jgi:phage terminase large subunit
MGKVKQITVKCNQWVIDRVLKSKKRYLVCKGGGSSGKSNGLFMKIVLRFFGEKNHRFLVVRAVYSTLKESCYMDILTHINNMGLGYRVETFTQPLRIKDKFNGNEILFAGLDDVEKLKSIKGVTGIMIEEASDITEADFDQLDLRLRDRSNNYKQICLAFNPVSEDLWLKKRFFDVTDPDADVVESTFLDNAFLDEQSKKVLEKKAKTSPAFYRIYALNEWGVPDQTGLFYSKFDLDKHIRTPDECTYDPAKHLYLSWDFNVLPTTTCLVSQLSDDEKTLHVIDEVLLQYPNNNTLAICQEFKRRYAAHRAGITVTGDASGKKQDSTNVAGFNNYTIIKQELEDYNPVMRNPNVNAAVQQRGMFINHIFEANYEGLDIKISKKCKKLIEDLSFQKQTNIGKDKSTIKDKTTGLVWQRYGHCSDAFDYVITLLFQYEFDIFQKGKRGFLYELGTRQTNTRYSF